jgi:hypothetical protein
VTGIVVPNAEEEARYRERHARQLPLAPTYDELAEAVEGGRVPERVLVSVKRRANHDAMLAAYVRLYGREQGIPAFRAYWYNTGPDAAALDAEAQRAYGVPFASLCCDRRRAVLQSVRAAEATA